MSSLVLELQRDALNPRVPVSNLLRKALVAARKLGLIDLETWVRSKLNGYTKPEDIPEYRRVRGEPKAYNPYHGWQPIQFPDSKTLAAASTKPCDQSISELEALSSDSREGTTLGMNFAPEQEAVLRRAIGIDLRVSLILQRSSIARILDAVRNAILEWALKLEKDGIKGEDLSFTPKERKVAEGAAYNIMNFFGPVQNSQIQHATKHSVQIQPRGPDLAEIAKFIASLKKQASDLPLTPEARAELDAEISTAEAQIGSPKPKVAVLRESLHSIRNILEGVSASVIATELAKYLPPLLAAFGP